MPDGPVSHQRWCETSRIPPCGKKDTLAAMAQVLLDDGLPPPLWPGFWATS